MKFSLLLVFLLVTVTSNCFPVTNSTGSKKIERYVVFPGLDADPEEVAEWSTGYATAFNVWFGPKPYVIGWVGEGPIDEYESENNDVSGDDKKNKKGPNDV